MKPCPVCQKPAVEPFKPFCSARCSQVDLHGWFSEKYRVPVKAEETGGDPARIPETDEASEKPDKKGT